MYRLMANAKCCCFVSWSSCTSSPGLPTMNMAFNQLWYLIEYQTVKVHCPQPAFQRSCAMGHYPYHLLHEALIWSDLPIPAIDQILHHDCNDGVELQVHIVTARQRRQQLIDGARLGVTLWGAKHASDQGSCRFVRDIRRSNRAGWGRLSASRGWL